MSAQLPISPGAHHDPASNIQQVRTVCYEDAQLTVNQMKDILQSAGQINLFRFFINPMDFAQSVENLYHLSFLFRDGVCGLSMTENQEPILTFGHGYADDGVSEQPASRQLVMEFDMATWRRAIVEFDINEAIVPHRPAGPR